MDETDDPAVGSWPPVGVWSGPSLGGASTSEVSASEASWSDISISEFDVGSLLNGEGIGLAMVECAVGNVTLPFAAGHANANLSDGGRSTMACTEPEIWSLPSPPSSIDYKAISTANHPSRWETHKLHRCTTHGPRAAQFQSS